MNSVTKRNATPKKLTPSQKKAVDAAAKKIVQKYGKTLQLLAKE